MKKGKSNNQRAAFKRWLQSRPVAVRVAGCTVKPWNTYRMIKTGQHCIVQAYCDDGSVRVAIVGHDDSFLAAMAQAERLNVFGVRPSMLEKI